MGHRISTGTPTAALIDEQLVPFMATSAAIDRDHPAVQLLASEVRRPRDIDTMRVAYDTVRDRYPHSMDIDAPAVSVSAMWFSKRSSGSITPAMPPCA